MSGTIKMDRRGPALGRDAQGQLNKGWNVILPSEFLNPSYEGMSPEKMP
jgi:hypothetical protein